MKRLFFVFFEVALFLGAPLTILAQSTSLNDSVPYQDHPLLSNPLPATAISNHDVMLDCDWPTLLGMLRDLEERIAGALGTDTIYDVYVSGEVVNTSIYMFYDCVVLRDSVISLQIQLDEALLGPPSVLSQEVLNIAQRVATIKAKITDDGGAPVRLWGVLFGKQAWWNDSLGFFEPDSLSLLGGGSTGPTVDDLATFMDSTLAQNWFSHYAAIFGSNPGSLPAAMDTATMMQDSIMLTTLMGLERYTQYIAIPIAANDSLMTEQDNAGTLVDGEELNVGPFGWYGMGDTLMFHTLPDTASGFTLDTANVFQNAARLIFTVADAGGQGPDDAGFYYDTLDFDFATFVGDSLPSDSTGGATHTAELTGLTRYTDYYFRGYADNLAGRGRSETSMTFRTLPDAPEVAQPVWQDGNLSARITDLGGDNGLPLPTSVELNWGTIADLTGASDSTVTYNSADSTFNANLPNLAQGAVYYARGKATNTVGTGQSTIGSFTTPVGITTDSISSISTHTGTIFSTVIALNATPSQVAFNWSENADLTAASDTSKAYTGPQNQMQLQGLDRYTTYYVSSAASNDGGTAYGDTISFTTLPEAPEVGLMDWSAVDTVLSAKVIDLGGDNGLPIPDSVQFKWSLNADMSDASDSAAVYVNADSTFALTVANLLNGAIYYGLGSATNTAGTGTSDTLQFETPVEVISLPTSVAISSDSIDAYGIVDYYNVIPDKVGLKWSQDSTLINAADSSLSQTNLADGWFNINLTGLNRYTRYYYQAFAVVDGDTLLGDTVYNTTLPEPITFGSLIWNEAASQLEWKVADLGGDNGLPIPQNPAISWSDNAQMTGETAAGSPAYSEADSLITGTASGFAAGKRYYARASASNPSTPSSSLEVHHSDTLAFETPVGISTLAATSVTNSTAQLKACFDFDDAIDQIGFRYGEGDTWANAVDDLQAFDASLIDSCSTLTYQGYTYDLIAYGSQCWFAENLQAELYRNGEFITGDLNNGDWASANYGAQGYYDNNSSDLADYGRLYNFHAVADGRNLCPTGWHVASSSEWDVLVDALGGAAVAGGKLKAASSDLIAWDGSNEIGFGVRGAGLRNFDGSYYAKGTESVFWATSPNPSEGIKRVFVGGSNETTSGGLNTQYGASVRCLRDNPYDCASEHTIEINGLARYTEYSFVGAATNANGNSYGDTLTFQTLPDIPTLDSLQWNPSTEQLFASFEDIGGPMPDSTYIKWDAAADLSSALDTGLVVSSADTTFAFTVPDLLPSATYHAAAFAENSAGIGISDTLTFQTLAEIEARAMGTFTNSRLPHTINDMSKPQTWGHDPQISADGNRIAFGISTLTTQGNERFVSVYEKQQYGWAFKAMVMTDQTNFNGVPNFFLSPDGNILAVIEKGINSGSDTLRVYRIDEMVLGQSGLATTGTGQIGQSISFPEDISREHIFTDVSSNHDGTRLVLGNGSYQGGGASGKISILDWNASTQMWETAATKEGAQGEKLGDKVHMNAAGTVVAAYSKSATSWASGSPSHNHGRVGVYDYSTGSLNLRGQSLMASMPIYFGELFAMSEDGNVIAVAPSLYNAPGSGISIQCFEYNGSAWVQRGSVISGIACRDLEMTPDGSTIVFVNNSSVEWSVQTMVYDSLAGDYFARNIIRAPLFSSEFGGSSWANENNPNLQISLAKSTERPRLSIVDKSFVRINPGLPPYARIEFIDLTAPSPSDIEPTSSTTALSGVVEYNDVVPSAVYFISPSTGDTIQSVLQADSTFTELITGLTPGKRYGDMIAVVENSAGAQHSESFEVWTKPEITTDQAIAQGSYVVARASGTITNPLEQGGYILSNTPTMNITDRRLASEDVLPDDPFFTDSLPLYFPGQHAYCTAYGWNAAGYAFGDTLFAGVTTVGFEFEKVVNADTTETVLSAGLSYGSAPPSSYGFKYGLDETLTSFTDTMFSGATNSASLTLNTLELEFDSTYYFVPYATNEGGTQYGDTMQFKVYRPIIDSITDITSSSFKVHISGAPEHVPATLSSLTLYYKPVGGAMWSNFSVFGDNHQVTNLEHSKNYEVKVRYTYADYSDYYSRTVLATTMHQTTAFEGVLNSTGTSALLTGSYSDRADDNVDSHGFFVGLDQTSATKFQVPMDGDTLYTLQLSGLEPDSIYSYRAYSTAGADTSFSNWRSFHSIQCVNKDYQGYTYDLVLIGNDCWFSENLRSTNFADGTAIQQIDNTAAWSGTNSSGYAINSGSYFYNGYAAIDSSGICPTGWRLRSTLEATNDYGLALADNKVGRTWANSVDAAVLPWIGTNTKLFNAAPIGGFTEDGDFSTHQNATASIIKETRFWIGSSDLLKYMSIVQRGSDLSFEISSIDMNSTEMRRGYQVRCMKDDADLPIVELASASRIEWDGARLNGLLVDNGKFAFESAEFTVSENADLSGATTVAGTVTDGAIHADVSDLAYSTTYYFTVSATNFKGVGYASDTLSFTTTSCTPVEFDGYTYETMEIAGECWFAENLRTSQFANGDSIPTVQDNGAWSGLNSPGRSIFDNDAPVDPSDPFGATFSDYGYLYNWHAVNDGGGLCPSDWRVASDEDWTNLTNALGGDGAAGQVLKASSTDSLPWNGLNSERFAALPGGERGDNGMFYSGGTQSGNAYFWTSTANGSQAWLRVIGGNSNGIGRYGDGNLKKGFSVRCVRNPIDFQTNAGSASPDVADLIVTLNGTLNYGGLVVSNGFEWGLQSDLSDGADVAGNQLKGSFSANLSGMTEGDTIYYAAFAETDAGTLRGDTLSVVAQLPPCNGATSVTYHGYDYPLVEIGAQCWFAENLRADKYADGDGIPGNLNDTDWASTSSGAQTINNTTTTDFDNYGRLYNWYAVSDTRGLCPSGWHVPTGGEWAALTAYLTSATAGLQMKSSPTDDPSWDGSNTSGFSGLPGGARSGDDGAYSSSGTAHSGYFWNSTISDWSGNPYYWMLSSSSDFASPYDDKSKREGMSVRCLLDE